MLSTKTEAHGINITSEYVDSQVLEKEKIVTIKTKGHCPGDVFRVFFDELLRQIQTVRPCKWYVNLANFSASPQDIDWFVNEWIPSVTALSGPQHYIAFVIPESIIYKYGIQRRLRKHFPDGCLHVMPIEQKEHAIAWLIESDK